MTITAPTDIAGLKYWARASDLTLSNGDLVASLTDLSGLGNHATQSTDANKPKFYTRQSLYLSGANGALAFTNDAAAVTVTGNATFVALGVLPDTNWSSNPAADYTIVGKWNDSTVTRGWKMKLVSGTSNIELAWTSDGTNQFQAINRDYSGVVTAGQRMDFAAEVEPNNSGAWAVRWYYRITGSGNAWTQLGATASGSGATGGIFDDSARLVVGSRDTGNNTGGAFFTGEIGGVQVWSGLAISGTGATLKAAPDFTVATYTGTGATADLTDPQGNVWTVNSPARMPMILNGHAALSFVQTDFVKTPSLGTLAQPVTLFIVGRVPQNGAAGATDPNFTDGIAGTNRFIIGRSYSASGWKLNAGSTVTGGTPDAGWHVFVAKANGASSILRVNGTQVIAANAGTQSLTGLTIGALNTPSNGLVGDIAEIGIYAAGLSSTDITDLETYLTNRYTASSTVPATVNAVTATATADAIAPTITAAATVAAVTATATCTMLAPAVSAAASVTATTATATATALPPAVGGAATVTAVTATATAAAFAPTVTAAATVAATTATATATMLPPIFGVLVLRDLTYTIGQPYTEWAAGTPFVSWTAGVTARPVWTFGSTAPPIWVSGPPGP